jgi:hypothetical protein
MISYTNIQLILLYTKKFCYICADNIPLANPWEFPLAYPVSQFLGQLGLLSARYCADNNVGWAHR